MTPPTPSPPVGRPHGRPRFFRVLLRGDVFERPETLGIMCLRSEGIPAVPRMDDDPSDSAMFLFRHELARRVFWGHGGYWGTTAYTCPQLDVTG